MTTPIIYQPKKHNCKVCGRDMFLYNSLKPYCSASCANTHKKRGPAKQIKRQPIAKVSNKRMDFLHKLSSKLISDNQAICFEDLNIKGMVKNHKLSQSISDVGWGEFVSQCKYKALWSGKHVLQIPRFEPSSKKCHVCGWNNNKLALSDRSWVCNCGTTHDRDINAAINIRDYCLKKISGEAHRIKPVELPVIAGAKKQEV